MSIQQPFLGFCLLLVFSIPLPGFLSTVKQWEVPVLWAFGLVLQYPAKLRIQQVSSEKKKERPLTWGPWSLHFSLHSTKLLESFSDSLSLSSNSPESRRRPVLQPILKMSKCPKRKNHRLLVTWLPKGFLSPEFYFISSLLFSQLEDIFKRDCLNMSNVLLGVIRGCTDCPNHHLLPKLNFVIYGSYWKVKKSSKCGYEMKHNVYRNVAKYDWREGKCHCLLVCQWSLR